MNEFEMKMKIADLEGEVNKLSAVMNYALETIDNLKKDIAELEEEKAALAKDVRRLQSAYVTSISERNADFDSRIRFLEIYTKARDKAEQEKIEADLIEARDSLKNDLFGNYSR